MVWNAEFGLFIPDPAWHLTLICGVGCRGGACRASGLGTSGGLPRVLPFPSLFLNLTPHGVRRTLPAK
jgi:hypothetical protein